MHIALVLWKVFEMADPGKLPCGHEVCWHVATLVFVRSHSVDLVQEAGQWSSLTSFAQCYLAMHVVDAPCMAMHTPTSGSGSGST